MTITTPEAEIKRDWRGRPFVIPPTGGKPVTYTRCTTYVGCIEDRHNLEKWGKRMVALGLASRPDYLMSVVSIGPPGDDKAKKKKLDEVCENSIEFAKGSAAATIGTAVHALTERIDRGQDVGVVPDAYKADLDAYVEATKDLTATHIEQFCVQDPLKIGGTPDRVVKYQGKRYIADLKTGDIELGVLKIAAQLAVYARSSVYDIATGQRSAHDADLDWGLIIHLPAGTGTCSLVWVDLQAGWSAVRVAKQVREQRALKYADLVRPFGEVLDPALVLETAIRACQTPEAVRNLWGAHEASWTDALTEIAKAHIASMPVPA